MTKVKVRYAPSPTGIPHIGNIRTALFNYLFAKNQGGSFLLRIEDTDRTRFVPGSVEKIKESLRILNLKWDGEETYQSKRLKLYETELEKLKTKDAVYKKDGAWYFKIPKNITVTWDDALHGKISFESSTQEDFVIIKSDNYPTYHFASVVDDHDMGISHVFRGNEWISSTPKHLLIYEALGYTPPIFVHLPPILGPSRKKLSKREGAESVFYFIEKGYLPEAIINFLAFLGWSPKNEREIFSPEELTREFSIDRINKNSPVFNLEKLNWFNMNWIKKLNDKDLEKRIQKLAPNFAGKDLKPIIAISRDRIKTLKDFEPLTEFFFNPPNSKSTPDIAINNPGLNSVISELSKQNDWTKDALKNKIDSTAQALKIDRIALIAAIRNIISGRTITPPLYESLQILGRNETLRRLKNYAKAKT